MHYSADEPTIAKKKNKIKKNKKKKISSKKKNGDAIHHR